MPRLWLLLLLLLAACAPRTGAPAYPPAKAGPGVLAVRDASGAILLNADLGLAAPLGSTLLFQRYQGKGSQSRFTSPERFDRMLLWLKAALRDLGWRLLRAELFEEPAKFYRAVLWIEKAGERRRVELSYRAGVYALEVRP